MRLGSVEVVSSVDRVELLTCLIWGKPGSGKTVLASTAPGKKLWLQFDPSGTASLKRSDDVVVADFSGYRADRLADFKVGGIIEGDLLRTIKSEGINTVVLDSITSFGQLALQYGIVTGKANRGTFKASIEQPGQTGYGVRTALIVDVCSMLLRVCADAGVHCILIAHDQDVTDDDGKLKETTISIGGGGRLVISAKISEIWMLSDDGKRRRIYIRAHGMWRPMRTRMFTAPDGVTSFGWTYDQDKQTGEGITDYYEAWRKNGFDKCGVPST
jgi:hypothetical protein